MVLAALAGGGPPADETPKEGLSDSKGPQCCTEVPSRLELEDLEVLEPARGNDWGPHAKHWEVRDRGDVEI